MSDNGDSCCDAPVIAGPPLVHPIPEIKAVVGKTLHIICPASGYPLDKITWARGQQETASEWRN